MQHPFPAAALALALSAGLAHAEPVSLGDLVIDTPWARASVGQSRPAAAYITIRNTGAGADRLTAITTPVAGMPMVHQSATTDGIARMTAMGMLEIPAGTTVMMAPGGLHVMLMDLTQALDKGATFPLTLTFQTAGEVTIEVPVLGIGAKGPEG